MKSQGQLAEAQFIVKSLQVNLVPCQPFGDNDRFDFITEYKGTINRVQVKSTSRLDNSNRNDRFVALCARGSKGKTPYEVDEIDYFAIYVIPYNIWYIIPVEALNGTKKIGLYPHKTGVGRYEEYKESWELLKKNITK